MKKIFVILLTLICFVLPVSASTYSVDENLANSSSYFNYMCDVASNDPKFLSSKYVAYRTSNNDYYLIYGDITYNNSTFTGSGVVIRYYRPTNTSTWNMTISQDYNITVRQNSHFVVSNIYGVYNQNSDRVDNFKFRYVFYGGLVILGGFVIFHILNKNRKVINL